MKKLYYIKNNFLDLKKLNKNQNFRFELTVLLQVKDE